MEHAPILERILIEREIVTRMNPRSVTRWVEENITANDGVVWKNKSKVHQNG